MCFRAQFAQLNLTRTVLFDRAAYSCACDLIRTVRPRTALCAQPGTVAAVDCYLRLPRRPGVTTFLCPAGVDTEFVDVPSTLRRFCSRYLPRGAAMPTVSPGSRTLRPPPSLSRPTSPAFHAVGRRLFGRAAHVSLCGPLSLAIPRSCDQARTLRNDVGTCRIRCIS